MALLRLHHGTDLQSANDIVRNGLDAVKAASYNGSGEFWASSEIGTADWFARTNPSNGQPARISFDIEESVLQQLCSAQPSVVFAHGPNDYEFQSTCFPHLNQAMKNKKVELVT